MLIGILQMCGISMIPKAILGYAQLVKKLVRVLSCKQCHKILSADYRLKNNVDCQGVAFTSIGTAEQPFTGSLDGDQYIISNLLIGNDGKQFSGLLGYTQGAYVIDLILKNAYVSGANSVGTLIGYAAQNSHVIDVSADGQVEAKGAANMNNIGGLIGTVNQSNITRSSAAVTVNASQATVVGGLVGQNQQGQILNSYALGSLIAQEFAGGLIGDNTGTMTNTFSAGKVTAIQNAGGLIARNTGVVTNSLLGY